MSRTRKRFTSVVSLALVSLVGCAGLTVRQEQGWTAFHDCQQVAPSAALEDLVADRVNYRTQEGIEFTNMKACMESRGYLCDLGLSIGSRPNTHCYARPS
jgi:hypothetical protein